MSVKDRIVLGAIALSVVGLLWVALHVRPRATGPRLDQEQIR